MEGHKRLAQEPAPLIAIGNSQHALRRGRPERAFRRGIVIAVLWCVTAHAVISRAQAATETNTPAQIDAVQAEMDAAIEKVKAIINRPATAYARRQGMNVGIFSPGWFHPGAGTPNYNDVDVRQTQECIYDKYQYVSSDLNPGVVWVGRDLEFNSMTKFFYTNRSLPKRKLTQAEMLEVNQLYRIIGRCKRELIDLQQPALRAMRPEAETDTMTAKPVTVPAPRANYVKAAIGVSCVLTLYLVYWLARRRRGC